MPKVYLLPLQEALGCAWYGTLTEAKRARNRLLIDGEMVYDIETHDAVKIINEQAARISELEEAIRAQANALPTVNSQTMSRSNNRDYLSKGEKEQ